jgi:hypothetical protein
MSPHFQPGDRVRIVHPNHEYTGSRGTIADAGHADADGVTVLGYEVAIDGENGLTRPFLAAELEPLRAARAGTRSMGARQPRTEQGPGPRTP